MNEQPNESILFEILKNLATNTEATKNIERHLVTLNGKVATAESFTQTLKSAQDLTSAAVAGLLDREQKRSENRSKLTWLTVENIFKAIFALAISYLLWKAGLS